MTSHLLLEGTFDVKDPKGSGDRKFWKVWRRLCASFFVVYPPGRREPFLQLNFSQSSSEVLEKEIKISRDGLRLFRCRSKSRPYRTWAIASGSKVVFYFAAEDEKQCQDSMQAVRDGLWPACFSFQMLTACSHEVSLIDDDNTFLSGLLGVYGRFVLTSEDVLSLMHPHWGATLLQISLSNIKDVLLVREAEGPAGVFKIVLKRMEVSKIKAFQFFCNTCKEAIQWILSKTENIEENKEVSERKKSFSSKYLFKTKTGKVNENFLISNISFSTEVPPKPYNNTGNDYENLQYLKENITLDRDLFLGTNTNILTSTKYESEISGSARNNQIFPKKSMEKVSKTTINVNENNDTENKSSNLKTNENIYDNITHSTYSSTLNTSSFSSCDSDHENECKNFATEKQPITNSRLKFSNDGLDTVEYAVVNKYVIKTSHNETLDTMSASNKNSLIAGYNNKAKLTSETKEVDDNKTDMNLSSKWNTIETETSFSSPTSKKSADPNFDHENIKILDTNLPSSVKGIHNTPCALQSLIYDNVNKNISKNAHGQNDQLIMNGSIKDYRNSETGNSCLPPILPSHILNTSTFENSNSDTTSRSFLHEEDIVSWATDERRNSTFNDSVYEDILDRKGTVYEEIDSSDDEYAAPLPPDLPKRPQNLDIPDSLRLQKLSKNIEQTLKVRHEIKPLTKEPKLNLVKKIKDVKRIMQISPNSEYAKKTFETETKLPVNGKNRKSLNPLPVNSYVIANKN